MSLKINDNEALLLSDDLNILANISSSHAREAFLSIHSAMKPECLIVCGVDAGQQLAAISSAKLRMSHDASLFVESRQAAVAHISLEKEDGVKLDNKNVLVVGFCPSDLMNYDLVFSLKARQKEIIWRDTSFINGLDKSLQPTNPYFGSNSVVSRKNNFKSTRRHAR